MLRVIAWAACVLLGAATGLASVAAHGWWWSLALGLAASVATVLALPSGVPRLGFVLGWVVTLLAAALAHRPEGDYLIEAGVKGYLLLAGAPLLLGLAVVTSLSWSKPPRSQPAGSSPARSPGADEGSRP